MGDKINLTINMKLSLNTLRLKEAAIGIYKNHIEKVIKLNYPRKSCPNV